MYAVILARGKGTRLWPYTDDRPKNMVEVAGKPILEHQINQLKKAAITDLVIPVGFKSEVIYHHFGDGSKWGIQIHYVQETTSAGSTGDIKEALETIPEEERDVILMYGDIISEVDLKELLHAHRQGRRPVTLWLRPNRVPVGVAQTNDQGILTSFSEKPIQLENTAICVISRNSYLGLPDAGDFFHDIPRLYLDVGMINSYISDARWWHITNEEDLRKADQELRQIILNAEGQSQANKERS